jgi:hypothetical protein
MLENSKQFNAANESNNSNDIHNKNEGKFINNKLFKSSNNIQQSLIKVEKNEKKIIIKYIKNY